MVADAASATVTSTGSVIGTGTVTATGTVTSTGPTQYCIGTGTACLPGSWPQVPKPSHFQPA
jgi:hypothetical protein